LSIRHNSKSGPDTAQGRTLYTAGILHWVYWFILYWFPLHVELKQIVREYEARFQSQHGRKVSMSN